MEEEEEEEEEENNDMILNFRFWILGRLESIGRYRCLLYMVE